MAFKPNYRFERNQRAKDKAAKKEAKLAERAARKNTKAGDQSSSPLTESSELRHADDQGTSPVRVDAAGDPPEDPSA